METTKCQEESDGQKPSCVITRIALAVRHQGHIPSFKNNKRAVMIKTAHSERFGVVTKNSTRKWMKNCIRSFELQLFSSTVTTAQGMLTAHSRHSLIASSVPADDSRQWIPEIHVRCIEVPEGEEGAEIIIERIR